MRDSDYGSTEIYLFDQASNRTRRRVLTEMRIPSECAPRLNPGFVGSTSTVGK